ncbi:MAG: hypothetical protein ABW033_10270 [Acidimicrobiia bacterium]
MELAFAELHVVDRAENTDDRDAKELAIFAEDNQRRNEKHRVSAQPNPRLDVDIEHGGECSEHSEYRDCNAALER